MSSDPLAVPTAGRDPLHRLHFSFPHLAAVLPALIVFRWPSDHPAVIAGLVALQGYVLFCWTSYFHECAHPFDPLLGTRTVVGTGVLTRVSSFLNCRIFVHGLHHRHPQLPHLELEGKMCEYRARNPEATYLVYGSYAAAVWAMLPHLVRNPGCGVNAGTPAPHGPPLDVNDFAPEGADLPRSAGGEPVRPAPLHAPAGTVTGLSQVHSASVNEPPATVSSR